AAKARPHALVGRQVAIEHLDRKQRRDASVRRAIHLTGATGSDALEDAVAVAEQMAEQRIAQIRAGLDLISWADAQRLKRGAAAFTVAHSVILQHDLPMAGAFLRLSLVALLGGCSGLGDNPIHLTDASGDAPEIDAPPVDAGPPTFSGLASANADTA